jgi:epothilone polyketide synthase D
VYPTDARCVRLPRYPWQHEKFWFDAPVDTAPLPTAPAPPREVPFSTTDLDGFLAAQVAESLGLRSVPLDRPLKAIGLDSLMASQLRTRVNRALGTALPVADFLGETTLRGLTDTVRAAVGN